MSKIPKNKNNFHVLRTAPLRYSRSKITHLDTFLNKLCSSSTQQYSTAGEVCCCFLICLSLFLQLYEIFSPTHGLQEHFLECDSIQRLHVPALVHIAGLYQNHLNTILFKIKHPVHNTRIFDGPPPRRTKSTIPMQGRKKFC